MIDIPRAEWIAMAWAARDAAQPGMNADRRAWFEGCKCLLLERDLPRSVTQRIDARANPLAPITKLRASAR